MTKHLNQSLANFGKRFAQFRKNAGYTQQELADEIGVTRRMIAYYETESEHIPANILVDLSRALSVTADQLLGLQPVTNLKVDSQLERKLRQVETLGPKARKQLLKMIDTVIETEQLKQQAQEHG